MNSEQKDQTAGSKVVPPSSPSSSPLPFGFSSKLVDGFFLRNREDSDQSFILSSWLKSNRDGPLTSFLCNHDYYDFYNKLVLKTFSRCPVLVAFVSEVPEEIAGWICYEEVFDEVKKLIVHYIYVKPIYRKVGVARMLLNAAGFDGKEEITATHVTYIQTDNRLDRAKYKIVSNPYLLLEVK